jgi:cytochrome oxidase Cu insertion factor (SCO1/SenC/PrrC family)
MPGMNSGLDADDPTVVAAFRAALAHQGIIALLIFAILSITWVSVRARASAAPGGSLLGQGEAPGHRVLRIGFGLLWLLDGVLQAQPQMAAGMPSQVIEPTAASSPPWVQHLVNWAGTTWSYHPIQAGAAAVWIQAGIGLWLLAAPRGVLGRLAGVASVAWGLVVWVFGESFGGIFAPGLTWLFGAPGAALVYCAAGGLLALPERAWRSPRLGRAMLGGLGLFLIGMAVLQAWPGRGFWQGTVGGAPGTLTGMIQTMAQTPQPSVIASLVSGFGSFVHRDGFAVNLVAVVTLAALGAAFLAGACGFSGLARLPGFGRLRALGTPERRRTLLRTATIAFVVLCLADWVLIEDLGFFGGVGTDPNSMIPMALLGVGGYLAYIQVPETIQVPEMVAVPATESASAEPAPPEPAGADSPAEGDSAGARRGWGELLRPSALRRGLTAATFGTMTSLSAIGVVILGAAPMAAAQATPTASTILAQAVDGASSPLDYPAPAFSLTDQRGQPVSLSSLRGRVVLLTFLDPVCVSDCPLIAQEFRYAGQLLGSRTSQVELVAVDVNPLYNQLAYTQAFDRQEELANVPNWLYLTSSPNRLRQVYANYGIASEDLPGGAMLGHSDIAFVIDQTGQMREELDFDPGPGTAATESSFAAELANAATGLLRAS